MPRRREEDHIHEILASNKRTSPLILIIGEAGHGKTSLLWHLYHALAQDVEYQPLFIQASYLVQSTSLSSSTSRLDQQLNLAVQEIIASRKRPIVLLDTIDLLLHDHIERTFLIRFLQNMASKGCAVVATLRPLEAKHLAPVREILNAPKRIWLGPYDEEKELPEAIRKHVSRFYGEFSTRQVEEHVNTIMQAVSQGLPVREVCQNPLALRMLFELYGPNPIPPEINSFRLYQQYWDARVVTDKRSGSPLAESNSQNLEEAAMITALIMLAEGHPEISIDYISSELHRRDIDVQNLMHLDSRGILRLSMTGIVRFFHQTFFEHSAAQGLASFFGLEAFELIKQRILLHPSDAFRTPVYEQLFLLAERRSIPTRHRADELFHELLRTGLLAPIRSAIYVYAYRQDTSTNVKEAISNVIQMTEHSVLVNRLIELLPNTSRQRLNDIFGIIDIIWNREVWQERLNLLNLLERLAARFPTQVKRFLIENKINQGLAESLDVQQRKLNLPSAFMQIAAVLLALIPHQYDQWCRDALIELYVDLLRRIGPNEASKFIIDGLYQHAQELSPSTIANRFEEVLFQSSLPFATQSDRGKVRNYGILWAIQWKANGKSIQSILEDFEATQGIAFEARLVGLSNWLSNATPLDTEIAFEHFRREEMPRQELWAMIVWKEMLQRNEENILNKDDSHDMQRPAEAAQWVLSEISRVFESRYRALLKKDYSDIESSDTVFTFCREAVLASKLDPNTILDLFDGDCFENPEAWLSENLFLKILLRAYQAGQSGALTAGKILQEEPAHSPGAASYLAEQLVKDAPLDSDVWVIAIEMLYKLDNIEQLARVLRQSDGISKRLSVDLAKGLRDRRRELVESGSGRDRYLGIRLWVQLIRHGLLSPPTLEIIVAGLKMEDSAAAIKEYILLIMQSAIQGSYEQNEVIKLLLPLLDHTLSQIRDAAASALLHIIEKGTIDSSHLEIALSIILKSQMNRSRTLTFCRIIQHLLPERVEEAANIIERFLLSPVTGDLGQTAKRRYAHRLRGIVCDIFRIAPPSLRLRLLNIVLKVDEDRGWTIIAGACLSPEVFQTLSEYLLPMSQNPEVPAALRNLIGKYRYDVERILGGTSWPELADQLASQ